MRLLDLFVSFAKIGVLTFGGGYSMLPILERECVDKHHWVTEEEMLNFYAIGQCTPGVIAVNTATFIGTKEKGIWGGIVATLGVVFPSFIIISLLASIIAVFKDNYYVIKAFSGIRVAVCALIISSIIKLCKKSLKDWLCVVLAFLSLVLQLIFSINSIFIVVGTIVFGIVYYLFVTNDLP